MPTMCCDADTNSFVFRPVDSVLGCFWRRLQLLRGFRLFFTLKLHQTRPEWNVEAKTTELPRYKMCPPAGLWSEPGPHQTGNYINLILTFRGLIPTNPTEKQRQALSCRGNNGANVEFPVKSEAVRVTGLTVAALRITCSRTKHRTVQITDDCYFK